MIECAKDNCGNEINSRYWVDFTSDYPYIISFGDECLIQDEAFKFTPDVLQQVVEHNIYEDEMTYHRYLWNLEYGFDYDIVVVFKTEDLAWNVEKESHFHDFYGDNMIKVGSYYSGGNKPKTPKRLNFLQALEPGVRLDIDRTGDKIVEILPGSYTPLCAECRTELFQLLDTEETIQPSPVTPNRLKKKVRPKLKKKTHSPYKK